MRVVIQRVSKAEVSVNGVVKAEIGKGFLVLVGIEEEDTKEDVEYLVRKVSKMRVFEDSEGKMNLSLKEINGEVLSISQFTLHADTKKGNRPSFIQAARPEKAIPFYEAFNEGLKKEKLVVKTGEFGENMAVSLVNDGPVTIITDSKNK